MIGHKHLMSDIVPTHPSGKHFSGRLLDGLSRNCGRLPRGGIRAPMHEAIAISVVPDTWQASGGVT
jgi:hypothetical protein